MLSVPVVPKDHNLPQQLLVANSLNRYKLSNASECLVKNSDGSMTLYLQHDAPKDAKQKANWLPTPAEVTVP